MSKDEWRKQMRKLPFPEKVKWLEKLRERELQIAKVRRRLKAAKSSKAPIQ